MPPDPPLMHNAPILQESWPDPDARSFEATYRETIRLLAYIARVRFRIPSEDADALIQDVFLKFARDYAHVREPRKWLIVATSNACRNFCRDRGRETPLPENAETWEDPRSAGTADAILTRLALGEALQQVGERCREMLRRFHLDGDSTQNIADAFGTTAGNVQFLLHSCRKKARSLYSTLTAVRP